MKSDVTQPQITEAEGLKPEMLADVVSLYETDYQLWVEQTLLQLKNRDFSRLDLGNLIEEIEGLGRSDRRAVSSFLMRLCEHLLKIKYWEQEREACLRGWKREVINFRLEIQGILKDSPSLRNYLNDNFLPEYRNGRKLFLNASGLEAELVPEAPEFTLEQALDENWLPRQPDTLD